MSIILELREHRSHAGAMLVHPTSEDVVLSNVFGVVKNLAPWAALMLWLRAVTGLETRNSEWSIEFWQKQPRPIGPGAEGSTVVDLVIESSDTLVFVEVKMDAPASARTTHDPNRNQLVRNLDVGFSRAAGSGRQFALVFITPDLVEPALVRVVRSGSGPFPSNPGVPPSQILACLHWTPWSSIGDELASAYEARRLNDSERLFARDLLAYLAYKRLWQNRLPDEKVFYENKLYHSLRRDGSPFVPYAAQRPKPYQEWRGKPWEEGGLRELLEKLRPEDRALLKVLAEAGGAMRQDALMQRLPMLRGKTSATLRALKSHVNAACKGRDRAPLLSEGIGSGPARVHQINPALGPLREVVVEAARAFEINWALFKPAGLSRDQRYSAAK